MNDKDNLLKRIQMYDFFLNEINLYLDTHPFCRNGLDYYNKYNALRKAACAEYSEKYGPLSISNVNTTDHWTWVDGPWPWEMEA